jgi:hypothetical protein
VGQILAAATTARWPMYLRNLKQVLRAVEGGFNERRYGFVGLIELLRACQREGLVRVERDRRGGLLVFKGPALRPSGPSPATEPSQEVTQAESEAGRMDALDTQPVEAEDGFEPEEAAEESRFNLEPSPTDRTAEPVDSAAPRRPRSRKAVPKKPPARATNRSKKPAGSQSRGKNKV